MLEVDDGDIDRGIQVSSCRSPIVSVIIPYANLGPHLGRTIHVLSHQTLPPESFEVILVGDGSIDDGTCDGFGNEVSQVPYLLRTVRRPSVFPSAGLSRNYGAARARGSILVFLDADMLADPNLLRCHLAHHSLDDGVVLGTRVLLAPEAKYGCGRWASAEDFINWTATQPQGPDERSAFLSHAGTPNWGCLYSHNFSIRAQMFQISGGFDLGFRGCGCEDVELGYRLHLLDVAFHYATEVVGFHQYHSRSRLRQLHSLNNLDHLVSLHPELSWFRAEVLAGWQKSSLSVSTEDATCP